MKRFAIALCCLALTGLTGCLKKSPSPELLAKLKGGTTTVVAFGFCVPMDHLIKTTLTRHTMRIVVDGKTVGQMKSCSYTTFKVASGYSTIEFYYTTSLFPRAFPGMVLRPGKTQYLYIQPAGNSTYDADWVSKEIADKRIAEIKQIGQIF